MWSAVAGVALAAATAAAAVGGLAGLRRRLDELGRGLLLRGHAEDDGGLRGGARLLQVRVLLAEKGQRANGLNYSIQINFVLVCLFVLQWKKINKEEGKLTRQDKKKAGEINHARCTYILLYILPALAAWAAAAAWSAVARHPRPCGAKEARSLQESMKQVVLFAWLSLSTMDTSFYSKWGWIVDGGMICMGNAPCHHAIGSCLQEPVQCPTCLLIEELFLPGILRPFRFSNNPAVRPSFILYL